VSRWISRLSGTLEAIVSIRDSVDTRLRQWLDGLSSAKHTSFHDDPKMFALNGLSASAPSAVDAHIERFILQISAIISNVARPGEFHCGDTSGVARWIDGPVLRANGGAI